MNDDTVSQHALPRSLFDTDLYKLTMQQAVLRHFPDAQAVYKFTHRDADVFFSRECYERFVAAIPHFSQLSCSSDDVAWLSKTCSFFDPAYLQYLERFRFDPSQVNVSFNPTQEDQHKGRIEISATGPWAETILWEVPLMACLSELYFLTTDKDWTYDGQRERTMEKSKKLFNANIYFSEFGTRRRRSFQTQDLVVETLIQAEKECGSGKLVGTSNVHLAQKYGIQPIGTIAHEWFMAVASLGGYEGANGRALDLWDEVYPNGPRIALTDTFSTDVFFKDFVADPARANRWTGLRQDSGDPLAFAPRAKQYLESIGADYRRWSIIYSDSLSDEKAISIKKQCDEIGFTCSFGIGTFLTNDFPSVSSGGGDKSKALNMVIKLARINDQPCIKISDDLTKNTGAVEKVKHVKELYGLSA